MKSTELEASLAALDALIRKRSKKIPPISSDYYQRSDYPSWNELLQNAAPSDDDGTIFEAIESVREKKEFHLLDQHIDDCSGGMRETMTAWTLPSGLTAYILTNDGPNRCDLIAVRKKGFNEREALGILTRFARANWFQKDTDYLKYDIPTINGKLMAKTDLKMRSRELSIILEEIIVD